MGSAGHLSFPFHPTSLAATTQKPGQAEMGVTFRVPREYGRGGHGNGVGGFILPDSGVSC